MQTGVSGATITVAFGGIAQVPGSGWQPGITYYIGPDGIPTTIVPTSGIVKDIGVGLEVDTLFIHNKVEVITS